jgi:hypothetical protein
LVQWEKIILFKAELKLKLVALGTNDIDVLVTDAIVLHEAHPRGAESIQSGYNTKLKFFKGSIDRRFFIALLVLKLFNVK